MTYLESEQEQAFSADKETSSSYARTVAATLSASLLTSACGGSGSTGTADNGATGTFAQTAAAAVPSISDSDAARFLAQASMGASREQIALVQKLGYAEWIDFQFSLPTSGTRWDWLVAKGFNDLSYQNSQGGFDASIWRKLIAAPDTLRQRITLALSELLVVSIDGLVGSGWKAFSAAAYLDLLEANAFGNYRTLLGQISTNVAMGQFLTFRGSTKQNLSTGAMPDENYARELMQLFTIGLVQLNADGTPKLVNGAVQETYGQADVTGLARVFTGWEYDRVNNAGNGPDFLRRPMRQVANRHETGASSFLGTTIPAGLSGEASLQAALDWIFAHPNVAPFISRQLIQKLVTSNPSPAYVGRVAAVFNRDTAGIKGNLRAVIRAILLDDEARIQPAGGSDAAKRAGKLREPILRFAAWARAFNAASPTDAWNIGNTSDPATRLGQSPMRSPSVFNFFRPGYVPPNSAIAAAGLVAPEFQLANESSVVGYVNFMQHAVGSGVGEVKADYSALMPLADNGLALLSELNLVLAAGQIGADNLGLMRSAIDSMPIGNDNKRINRINAAMTLVLAAPEFIVLK